MFQKSHVMQTLSEDQLRHVAALEDNHYFKNSILKPFLRTRVPDTEGNQAVRKVYILLSIQCTCVCLFWQWGWDELVTRGINHRTYLLTYFWHTKRCWLAAGVECVCVISTSESSWQAWDGVWLRTHSLITRLWVIWRLSTWWPSMTPLYHGGWHLPVIMTPSSSQMQSSLLQLILLCLVHWWLISPSHSLRHSARSQL